jgi:hypothetical protein
MSGRPWMSTTMTMPCLPSRRRSSPRRRVDRAGLLGFAWTNVAGMAPIPETGGAGDQPV